MSESRKQSVLVLAHSAAVGGAELALASLIESTRDRYDWHVVFSEKKNAPHKLLAHATSVSYLDLPWWCYEAQGQAKKIYKAALLNDIEKLKSFARAADILLTNTITVPWLGLIAHELGKPHIWYIHEYGDLDHHYNFVAGYDQSLRLIGSHAHRVLTISNAVKDHLSRIIPACQIDIINQAVNAEALANLPVSHMSDPIRLLALGGIKRSKGQHIALEAAQQLQNVSLDIVGPSGDDVYVACLESAAATSSNVSLQVRAYDVAQELGAHDVVLMCSQNEALGRITLEALAAGKLVIGYACAATKELLAEGRGILYTPNTSDALAAAIQNARQHPIDVEKNRQFVKENYGLTKQAADFQACADKALTSPPLNTPAALENYLSLLNERSLFVGFAGHLKQQGRKLVVKSLPGPVRKSLKKIVKVVQI